MQIDWLASGEIITSQHLQTTVTLPSFSPHPGFDIRMWILTSVAQSTHHKNDWAITVRNCINFYLLQKTNIFVTVSLVSVQYIWNCKTFILQWINVKRPQCIKITEHICVVFALFSFPPSHTTNLPENSAFKSWILLNVVNLWHQTQSAEMRNFYSPSGVIPQLLKINEVWTMTLQHDALSASVF